MKSLFLLSFILLIPFVSSCQSDNEIRLLVRGDDIGSFHAANVGCIESYQNGIMRSTEVMVPCPWYPEAVKMLNENPGLDVGIHLVLTSEWDNMKWRPLTGYSTLTDKQGYFFPMVWPNDNYPPEMTFRESGWTIEDVEKELRAQIELAVTDIENVSHISGHMGFTSASPEIDSLVETLAKEYNLYIDMKGIDLKRLHYRRPERESDYDTNAQKFAEAIRSMEPGTYLFIEHPAMNTAEMETVGLNGNYIVGKDREAVTYIFTSDVVKKAIEEKKVKLISYQDLKR